MRGLVLVALGGLLGPFGLGGGSVWAQASSTGAPAPSAATVSPAPPQDRGGDVIALAFAQAAPLRLSLQGSIFAQDHFFPNCASREDAAGNSIGGIPLRHELHWQLAPHLFLAGFTQLGCPIDGGIGAVLTYAVPLRPSLDLVFSAGMYGVPGQLGLFGGSTGSPSQFLGSLSAAAVRGLRTDSPVSTGAGVDLLWSGHPQHPMHIGFGSLGVGRQQGIRLGGGF